MQRGTRRNLRTTQQRVAHPIAKEPSMHAMEEQTRTSWAKSVARFDEVPEVFKDLLNRAQGDGREPEKTALGHLYSARTQI